MRTQTITEYVPYAKTISVQEHRAPTDESISLLNEMQEKTLENIVKTINVKDNTLNAAVIYMVNMADMDTLKFVTKFTFNGRDFEIKGEINRGELIGTNKYGSMAVQGALAKKLVCLIADNVFKEVPDLSRQFVF